MVPENYRHYSNKIHFLTVDRQVTDGGKLTQICICLYFILEQRPDNMSKER